MMRYLAILPLLVHPVFGEIQFRGIVFSRTETKFAVVDTVSGVSEWMALGQQFSGYFILDYDPVTSEIILGNASGEIRVRLSISQVLSLPDQQTEKLVTLGRSLAESGNLVMRGMFTIYDDSLSAASRQADQIRTLRAKNKPEMDDELRALSKAFERNRVHAERMKRLIIEQMSVMQRSPNPPNKSLQPTPTAVTPPAAQEIVPAVGVAEH
jgi:hypothetical protein